jgi:1-acyl-sn-glycerol-3-phosphate acyltransferase
VGPLLPDDGPAGGRYLRRLRGIAAEALAFVLVTLLLPALAAVAVVVDLTLWLRRRKPWMATRLLLFAWWFLAGELLGMTSLLVTWLSTGGPFVADHPRRRRWVYRTRIRWAGGHFGGVRVIFGLVLEVEGLEHGGPGPVLIMIRHASIIDNMMPDAVIGKAHRIGLRFVLKRELQMIPTIDIGGRMVPTTFVRRASRDPEAELVQVRKLAVDLGPDEGVLIYPEGTRHTAAKLAKAQATIAERQPHVAPYANRLRHVLPPRLGGPLALLEESAGRADVVFCGHVGLDGFEYISDIWSGGLVGTTVRVKLWRHPGSAVPDGEQERIEWLYAQWQVLDDWIGEQRALLGSSGLPPKAAAALAG